MDKARIRGVRGAVTVAEDSKQAIIAATEQLLTLMTKENDINSGDIISVIFSLTSDLNAVFPAEAARRLGWNLVPLLCTTEIPVAGSMGKCIRVLMHVYTERGQAEVRHVYLGEAARLRPDLGSQTP